MTGTNGNLKRLISATNFTKHDLVKVAAAKSQPMEELKLQIQKESLIRQQKFRQVMQKIFGGVFKRLSTLVAYKQMSRFKLNPIGCTYQMMLT